MPIVEVRSSCVLSRRDFNVETSMKEAVDLALDSAGSGLQLRSVCFQGSGEVIQGWNVRGRLLRQDIVVDVVGESLSNRVERQQKQIDKQASDIAELHELHAKAQLQKLRNVSSQILLVASGERFRETKSTRFRNLGASDSNIQTAAASLNVSPQEFITAADGIVTRRNKAIHPSDVEELDEAVEEMVSLITPTLERMAKWECIIIKNYTAIKAAFSTSPAA